MDRLLHAISVILAVYAFAPNELLQRTWVKPQVLAHVTDSVQVLYVHRDESYAVCLTLWEGPATAMTKLGTYTVATEGEFVDLLADCGWL